MRNAGNAPRAGARLGVVGATRWAIAKETEEKNVESLNRNTEDWYIPVGAILVIAQRKAANSRANTRFAPTRSVSQCPNVVWFDLAGFCSLFLLFILHFSLSTFSLCRPSPVRCSYGIRAKNLVLARREA